MAIHKNKKFEIEWVTFASFLITINTHKIDEIKAISIHQISAFWKKGYFNISSIFMVNFSFIIFWA
jgi:hypothetical protein